MWHSNITFNHQPNGPSNVSRYIKIFTYIFIKKMLNNYKSIVISFPYYSAYQIIVVHPRCLLPPHCAFSHIEQKSLMKFVVFFNFFFNTTSPLTLLKEMWNCFFYKEYYINWKHLTRNYQRTNECYLYAFNSRKSLRSKNV